MQIQPNAPGCYQLSMQLKIRIRELRNAKSWTLEEMAGKIGISTPHLSEIERGKKNLNNHLIERIASVLQIEHHELFVDDRSLSDELAEVQAMFDELSLERQTQLLEFARFLRAQQDSVDTEEDVGGTAG
ncbi:helix-turn-helix domain-containing protein [uncultured Tateyamaria sp.]|uniref:helix-turn-helix domain-containing protein n=1 Tax=uncultured Tateyamaria sp. TaxID=455651 RepID=UPI0026298B87|nr:helix-turn-helix transcriptional regulator [uncultured Tateyamaria sp.]